MCGMVDSSSNLSTVGKLFLLAAGAFVLGKPTRVKVKGTSEEVEALKGVLVATKRFHDTLQMDNITAEKIVQLLAQKRAAAEKFQSVFNVQWHL